MAKHRCCIRIFCCSLTDLDLPILYTLFHEIVLHCCDTEIKKDVNFKWNKLTKSKRIKSL